MRILGIDPGLQLLVGLSSIAREEIFILLHSVLLQLLRIPTLSLVF